MKQKEYVCGYSNCLHKGEKVPSEIAVKDGTRYFHFDCYEEKKQKTQIFKIYYKYYKSTEDYAVVRKAINDFCKTSNSEFVLYILCQSIKEKVPYKSIYTLGWLVKNNMEFKKKYVKMKASRLVKNIDFTKTEVTFSEASKVKQNKKKNWEETLFGRK